LQIGRYWWQNGKPEATTAFSTVSITPRRLPHREGIALDGIAPRAPSPLLGPSSSPPRSRSRVLLPWTLFPNVRTAWELALIWLRGHVLCANGSVFTPL
jgi:hypothetical protein